MNTPMSAALTRAIATACLTIFVTGYSVYTSTNDIKAAIIAAASSAIAILGGRGLVEGSIDSVRQVRATQGDRGSISTADVSAFAPPLTEVETAKNPSP